MNEETKKVIRIAIVLGIICLVLLIVTGPSSILVRGLMIGIACLFVIGGFIMRWPVEVGLLILSLAFVVSFFSGIYIDLGEGRIIYILEANPHRYLDYMWDAFLYLILPLTVGLAYSIIAFVRERKSPTGVLEWWLPLMLVGGFFFFWGIYGGWRVYTNYLDVIRVVNEYGHPVEIANILKFCLGLWIGDILWMFAGFLFMLSPVFKMMEGRKMPHYITV